MKPNYNELARIYGLDWNMIKKYYVQGGKNVITRKSDSGYSPYKDEIS